MSRFKLSYPHSHVRNPLLPSSSLPSSSRLPSNLELLPFLRYHSSSHLLHRFILLSHSHAHHSALWLLSIIHQLSLTLGSCFDRVSLSWYSFGFHLDSDLRDSSSLTSLSHFHPELTERFSCPSSLHQRHLRQVPPLLFAMSPQVNGEVPPSSATLSVSLQVSLSRPPLSTNRH